MPTLSDVDTYLRTAVVWPEDTSNWERTLVARQLQLFVEYLITNSYPSLKP